MKKKIAITILYIIGIAIFVFLVWDFGFGNIALYIKKTGWWFLPITGIWILIYFLNAAAWYVIIGEEAKKIGFLKIYFTTIGGFAINYITPFVMLGGEPYRVFVLRKHIGTSQSVASVTIFTLMHMLSHFALWLLAIPFLLIYYYSALSHFVWVVYLVFIFLLSLLYFFITRHEKGFFTPIIVLIYKLPIIKSIIPKNEKWSKGILEVDEKIKNFYVNKKRDFYLSFLLEFLSRIVASVEFWFALHAIDINITLVDSLLINAGISFLLNIIFFMPLELGAREGSLYLVFKILTIGSGEAIYISLVNRIRELVWIFIGLILIRLDVGKKKKLNSFIIGEESKNGIAG